MSTYVMSDLHGNYNAFMTMLAKIDFKSTDRLFVIGDIIDRNVGSVKLLKYIHSMKNARIVLGNHEDMMLTYYSTFSLHDKLLWYDNGGDITKNQLEELPPDEKKELLDWVKKAPLTRRIRANKKTYIIGHACPYSKTRDDIIWYRIYPEWKVPSYAEQDVVYICGHTPTINFKDFDERWEMVKSDDGKVLFIDCGAAYPEYSGSALCCLRLNDEQVFYVDAKGDQDER